MEDVVQEKTIHIQVTEYSFFVLDAYRTLLRRLLQHQLSKPTGAVMLTGQPGTGWSVSLNSAVPTLIELSPGKTTWLWFLLVVLLAKGRRCYLLQPWPVPSLSRGAGARYQPRHYDPRLYGSWTADMVPG